MVSMSAYVDTWLIFINMTDLSRLFDMIEQLKMKRLLKAGIKHLSF